MIYSMYPRFSLRGRGALFGALGPRGQILEADAEALARRGPIGMCVALQKGGIPRRFLFVQERKARSHTRAQ